ncbi:glycosyltransferase [Alkalicaulis satelles]|uniref:Glycosyltransferase n=1 Tax=Alkalicaulis satelles TaxID=2609175 RepID=A0A5M6ZFY8_9PROT|nr:glycosyltransferase [Alkalicaulis satelles]KAA5803639.1 glycosyltransferase [Alkalicaulis satelles]
MTTEPRDSATPAFAIAMPVGAWHPLLPAVLESLKAQDMPLEIAFMDASGDARVRDCADASAIAFAVRREGPDGGQAAAIADGWSQTRAPILGWLNADDQLAPGALQTVLELFEAHPDAGVVHGGSQFVDIEGEITGQHDQLGEAGPLLYRANLISQPSCFVRRASIEAVGGINRALHYTMDWDLWVRLHAAGTRFVRTDAILSRVYMGQGTKTADINARRLWEIARLVNRHAGPWNALKSAASFALHPLRSR